MPVSIVFERFDVDAPRPTAVCVLRLVPSSTSVRTPSLSASSAGASFPSFVPRDPLAMGRIDRFRRRSDGHRKEQACYRASAADLAERNRHVEAIVALLMKRVASEK